MISFTPNRFLSFRNPGGFTLIELAIVMTVIGLLVMPLMGIYSKSLDQKYRTETKENMAEIRKAMAQYYYTYHKYPCPAPLAKPEDNSLDPNTCDFKGDTDKDLAGQSGLFVHESGGDRVISGSVPYRLLNIGKESTFDGWGSLFVYTVSHNSTVESFKPGVGQIGIIDTKGLTLINPSRSALWVLLSHGEDRSGAYNGQIDAPTECQAEHLDGANCTFTGDYIVSPLSQGKGPDYYDDFLYYQTWAELPEGISTPYCTTNRVAGDVPSIVQEGTVLRLCGNQPGLAVDGREDDCGFYICRSGAILPMITNIY